LVQKAADVLKADPTLKSVNIKGKMTRDAGLAVGGAVNGIPIKFTLGLADTTEFDITLTR
jgi:hypothetical protein